MIDLPLRAEVHCPDGVAGFFTYVIENPINQQVTYLVVKSSWPPFQENLVSIGEVEETTSNRINLKCTRNEFEKLEPFVRVIL